MKFLTMVALMAASLSTFAAIKINGAGATFPYPIYSKWFSEYQKVNTDVRLNYQSIGSGGGVRQTIKGTVDFGASDVPMKSKELKKVNYPILHVPTVLGAVVVTYNLKIGKIKLDGKTVSEIFLGKITKWNDAAIAKLNPKIELPAKDILVVRRADRSGTSAIFTDYLSSVNANWKEKVGAGKQVKWPTGIAGKGNEGVTGVVKQTPGAIGYVELAYAIQNKLPYASIKNQAGNFVDPSLASISASAAHLAKKNIDNIAGSIVNSSVKDAYPITAMTYILLPLKKEKSAKFPEIVKFLNWALTDGQNHASKLHYAPLPKKLAKGLIKKINSL